MKIYMWPLAVLFILISAQLNGQTPKKTIRVTHPNTTVINLGKLSCTFDYIKSPDTLSLWVDGLDLKISITSSKGACSFYAFNKKHIYLKGAFADARKLTEQRVYVLDKNGDKSELRIQKEYKPVPTGQWVYYSATGKVLKQEMYVNGKIVN